MAAWLQESFFFRLVTFVAVDFVTHFQDWHKCFGKFSQSHPDSAGQVLTNLKSTWTWILQLTMSQIDATTVSHTKTCVASLRQISVHLPSNKSQSYIFLTEMNSSCHQKPFPQGHNETGLLHSRIDSQSMTQARKDSSRMWIVWWSQVQCFKPRS